MELFEFSTNLKAKKPPPYQENTEDREDGFK